MPRRPTHDMTEFKDWLEEDRLVQPTTSRSYSAVVSAILTAMNDEVTQENLDAVFEPRRGNSSYANYRTAWKAFHEFAFERGVTLPTPAKKVVEREVDSLPDAGLRLASLFRENKFSPATLRALTWKHIAPSQRETDCYDVYDPYRPASSMLVPASIVDPWRALWEVPGQPDLPLFSEVKGSRVRYPTKLLMRHIKRYNAGEKEGAKAGVVPRSTGAAVSVDELREAQAQRLAEAQQRTKDGGGAALVLDDKEEASQEITPSHTTADLMAIIESGPTPDQPDQPDQPDPKRQSLPGEAGPIPLVEESNSEEPSVGEAGASTHAPSKPSSPLPPASSPEDEDDSEPSLDYGDEPTCTVCGHPKSEHILLFRDDYILTNCAEHNGYEADTCQMCRGTCAGPHAFTVGE